MMVYAIADIKITDDSWLPSYAANVHNIVEKHGGKYLSRTDNVITAEGKALDTSIVALIQFPSMQALQNFASDSNYEQYRDARIAGSITRLHILEGKDSAGTIPYLPKG